MPRRTSTLYSPHPSITMVQSTIAKMQQKTGRTLAEWVELVKNEGPPTEAERRDWLKNEHGFGTNYAWWVAERAEGKGWEDDDPELYLQAAEKYVEEMFTGSKASLRPIYDRLLALGFGIAEDIKACPCKTIVPLYRDHVIAEIKPSTRTRIDFGLALGKYEGEIPERLIDTGGKAKKDRITHRIPITAIDEIDGEVEHWLRVAYELDAK